MPTTLPKPFGSHADRHAHIGEGEIGLEAFRLLVNDPRLAGLPIIVETPDSETMHEVNLEPSARTARRLVCAPCNFSSPTVSFSVKPAERRAICHQVLLLISR